LHFEMQEISTISSGFSPRFGSNRSSLDVQCITKIGSIAARHAPDPRTNRASSTRRLDERLVPDPVRSRVIGAERRVADLVVGRTGAIGTVDEGRVPDPIDRRPVRAERGVADAVVRAAIAAGGEPADGRARGLRIRGCGNREEGYDQGETERRNRMYFLEDSSRESRQADSLNRRGFRLRN
jgi:hypothetical protein